MASDELYDLWIDFVDDVTQNGYYTVSHITKDRIYKLQELMMHRRNTTATEIRVDVIELQGKLIKLVKVIDKLYLKREKNAFREIDLRAKLYKNDPVVEIKNAITDFGIEARESFYYIEKLNIAVVKWSTIKKECVCKTPDKLNSFEIPLAISEQISELDARLLLIDNYDEKFLRIYCFDEKDISSELISIFAFCYNAFGIVLKQFWKYKK